MLEMRTIYPSTVGSANRGERVLKSGVNSQKLGDKVIKGVWAESRTLRRRLD